MRHVVRHAPHFDEYSHSHSIRLGSLTVVLESLNAPPPSKLCHTLTEEQLEPRVDYNSSVPALVDQLTATSLSRNLLSTRPSNTFVLWRRKIER